MDIEKFEKDMAVFSFGKHQNALTYLKRLANTGWTLRDAVEWVEYKKLTMAAKNIPQVIFLCQECGTKMALQPVNTGPADQTGDPEDNSVWLCLNNKCMEAIYNKQTVSVILEELKGDN